MQAERKPLSNEELDRLNQFLTSRGGPRAMNIEELDGYLAALVVGPDLVMPSEYLPLLWGDDPEAGPEYQSLEEANTILLLNMRHWNTIAAAVEKNERYLPVILEPEHGMPRGHRWARGFMRGVQLRRASWADLVHDDAEGGAIFSIAPLAGDVDPEFLKKPVPPDKQEQLLQYAIAGLHRIQQYFAPQRRSPAMAHTQVTTVRRTTPKVGRNEPCPCGSGRKFKQCCGQAGKPALH